MSWSAQLHYIFTDRFILDHLIFLEWDFCWSAMSNHKKLIDATVSFLLVAGSWCSTIFRHGHFEFWKTVFSCVFLLTLCLHIARYLRVVESALKYYAFCNGPLANFAKTKERNRVEAELTSLEFPLYEHVQKKCKFVLPTSTLNLFFYCYKIRKWPIYSVLLQWE